MLVFYMIPRECHEYSEQNIKKIVRKKWRLPLCFYLVRYKQLRGSLLSIDSIVSGIIFKHQNTVMFISWEKNLEHKFIFFKSSACIGICF